MNAKYLQRQPVSEWFVKPQSPMRKAAMWATAKVAAGLQNLGGNRYSEGFGVLMYHRVAEHVPGVSPPTLNVTPKQLRQQLAGLLARGFRCWPLTKLVMAHLESRSVPANVFAVTFDDGYENNYIHAWPILRELNIPGTIFVATKYLDTDRPFPFDDWSATAPKERRHRLGVRFPRPNAVKWFLMGSSNWGLTRIATEGSSDIAASFHGTCGCASMY